MNKCVKKKLSCILLLILIINFSCHLFTTYCNSSFNRGNHTMSIASNLIRDLPKGPLDTYRKRATFDWKSLKLNLEGAEGIQFQVLKFADKF